MRWLLVLVVVSSALGCESREQEANELALLLQRVQGYTDADDSEQSAQLEALRRFSPRTKRVREARAACLDAYTLVERAENDHAEAKRMLTAVTAGTADLEKTRSEIQRRIDRSNVAIDQAKPRINRCQRLISDLKREHRR